MRRFESCLGRLNPPQQSSAPVPPTVPASGDPARGHLTRAQWRRLIVSGYGPTLLASIGFGAVIPLISLSALHLGASVGTAALITSLLGVGQLAGDLPAGTLAARFGEKRAMIFACLFDAAALLAIYASHSLLALGLAVFADGLTGAVFNLARQTYLTEAIPVRYRARALSSLGGVFRVGYFVGPMIGAWIISAGSIRTAFVFASCMSLAAAGITAAIPDLPDTAPGRAATRAASPPGDAGAARGRRQHISTWQVLREHRFVLLTQGSGVMALMMVRSARQAIIPLWCDAHGLAASTTSLIFALSMGFDVLLFFPGGAIMDRFGRWWVVVPAMVVMGLGLVLLAATHEALGIGIVAALLGVGNGISSGIVMTLGSDASPDVGRPQFLSGWRLFGDLGNSIGPMVITLITGFAPLAAASVVLGVLSWAGAAWLGHWVPRGRRPVA